MHDPLILIADIRISRKSPDHPVVLTATAGSMIEMDPIRTLVFVPSQNATEHNGGPTREYFYKIAYTVAGERESLRRIAYQGYADAWGYYVFHN